MANLSYIFTDLSKEHSYEQQLRYASSSSFDKDWNSILHSHECAELFYVTDGTGWFCTDDVTIPIEKNQMVIVNPKVQHTERSSEKQKMHYIVLGIDHLQFHFEKDKKLLPFQRFTLTTHKEEFLSLFSSILKELKTKKSDYDKICEHYLSILLLLIKRITGNDFTLSVPNQIPYECEKARIYIEEHFREHITLELLADITHWDKFYFSHQFSKAYGIAPINFLLEQRIQHSKQLLHTTDYSITQIAEYSGFSSQNYFSQIFRRSTGISPREYRNNIK